MIIDCEAISYIIIGAIIIRISAIKVSALLVKYNFSLEKMVLKFSVFMKELILLGNKLVIIRAPRKITSKWGKTRNLCLSNPCGNSIVEMDR